MMPSRCWWKSAQWDKSFNNHPTTAQLQELHQDGRKKQDMKKIKRREKREAGKIQIKLKT